MWYKPEEALRRFAIFFNSVTLAGAFGGLLASAIYNMDGLSRYAGWRYIFIVEGVLTIVVAFVAFFIIVDFPEDAKWFTPDERKFMQARLQTDDFHQSENITLKQGLKSYFSNYKSYLAALLYFGKSSFFHVRVILKSPC